MKTEFWYPPGFPRAEERFLQRCALGLVSLAGFIIFLCQFSTTLRGQPRLSHFSRRISRLWPMISFMSRQMWSMAGIP